MRSGLWMKRLGLLVLAGLVSPAVAQPDTLDTSSVAGTRILLVGNSILYTGNVPATLSQVASRAGTPLDVAMYAQPGAKVSDIVNDTLAMNLLSGGGYDTVVFHDQGGNSLCMVKEKISESCEEVLDDHRTIVQAVRAAGGTPYLLGTYQWSAESSQSIEQAEARIAKELGVVHIPVSENWLAGKRVLPDSAWLADDDLHPGSMLTVMMAMEIYQAVTGKCSPVIAIEGSTSAGIPLDERDGKLYQVREHVETKGSGASVEEVRTLMSALSPECLDQGK